MKNMVIVVSNPVDPDDIALIFDGSRYEQRFVGMVPDFGPVGNVNEHIVIEFPIGEAVPAPDRKPKVVTDLQSEIPTIQICDFFIFPL
jgi:hypothetical protein